MTERQATKQTKDLHFHFNLFDRKAGHYRTSNQIKGFNHYYYYFIYAQEPLIKDAFNQGGGVQKSKEIDDVFYQRRPTDTPCVVQQSFFIVCQTKGQPPLKLNECAQKEPQGTISNVARSPRIKFKVFPLPKLVKIQIQYDRVKFPLFTHFLVTKGLDTLTQPITFLSVRQVSFSYQPIIVLRQLISMKPSPYVIYG